MKKKVSHQKFNEALSRYDAIMKDAEQRIKGITAQAQARRAQIQAKYEAIVKKIEASKASS